MSESRERGRDASFAPTELRRNAASLKDFRRLTTEVVFPRLPTLGYGTWEGCYLRMNELSFDSFVTVARKSRETDSHIRVDSVRFRCLRCCYCSADVGNSGCCSSRHGGWQNGSIKGTS